MFHYRLRTLVILLLVLPPVLALAWLLRDVVAAILVIVLTAALYVGFWMALGLVVGSTVMGCKRLIAKVQGQD